MSSTFQTKSQRVKEKFLLLSSAEARYTSLIELGKTLATYTPDRKNPEYIVQGCQSTLYLCAKLQEGMMFFQASSDALISAGLAALLLSVYNGETPETVLSTPPDFLLEMGIAKTLSPNRSNGLSQIHLRMKQLAINFFILK